MRIAAYTSSKCFYCLKLKRILYDEGIQFEELSVDEERYLKEFKELYKVTQTDALPTILVGEHLLVPGKSFNKIEDAVSIIKKLIKKS